MRYAAAGLVASALLGLGGPAPEASAGATVDLLFVAVNGSAIAPTPTLTVGSNAAVGDRLTMAVVLRNDEALTVAVFSLGYDLDGGDEVDVVTAFQWRGVAINKAGSDFFAPLVALGPASATFVGSFQGSTTNFGLPRVLPPAGGAFAGGYQMGTVTWQLRAGADTDGADILSGFLDVGGDAFGDAAFGDIGHLIRFNAATLNAVPEPATASLLGLGLLALALSGRRRQLGPGSGS